MKKTTILVFLLGLFLFGSFNISAQDGKSSKHPKPFERSVKSFYLIGDGHTDDTNALNAWGRGERVIYKGRVLNNVLQTGTFLITWKITFNRPHSVVKFNTFVRRYTGFDSLNQIDYGRRVRHFQNSIIDENTDKNRRRKPVYINVTDNLFS